MGLPWVRLDTGFPDNPKVLELLDRGKHRALVAYVCSMAWAGRQETRGLIPRSALPFLHATKREAAELVRARLWDETDQGWSIHDFGEYQLTNVTQAQRHNAAVIAACKRWHAQPCSDCSPVDPEVM